MRKDLVFDTTQAAAFFDLSYDTLRVRLTGGQFEGVEIGQGTPYHWRQKWYTLDTIREMAHHLRRAEAIDNKQLTKILGRVDSFRSPIGPIRWQRAFNEPGARDDSNDDRHDAGAGG